MSDYTYTDPTHTVITNKKVDAPKVAADELTLKNVTIKEIEHNLTGPSIFSIPSSNATFNLYKELIQLITTIDPNNNLFIDNTVVSLPLLNRYLSSSDWYINGWEPSLDNKYVYTGSEGNNLTNGIHTLDYPFNRAGEYFININIDALDSGEIIVYDQDNNQLAKTSTPGELMCVINVAIPSITRLYIKAQNVHNNEVIIISSIDIYYITLRLKQFMSYYIPIALSKKYQFVTEDDLRIAIHTLNDEFSDILQAIPSSANFNVISNHVITTGSNIHKETPLSIGAASKVHTHTSDECGAAPVDHTHVPSSIGAADREHTHVPSSIGAADREHRHDPSDCDAAPVFHSHSEYVKNTEVETLMGKHYIPMTVISKAFSLEYPYIQNEGNIPYVPQIIGTNRLVHYSNNDTDQYSGYIFSSKVPSTTTVNSETCLLSDTIRLSSSYGCRFSALGSSDSITIGYKFNCRRPIASYTISRQTESGSIWSSDMAYPTKWTVKLDNDIIHENYVPSWGSSNSITVPINITDEIKVFELIVTQANVTDKEIGIKLSINYGDNTYLSIIGNKLPAVTSTTNGNLFSVNIPTTSIDKPSTITNDAGLTIYPYMDFSTTIPTVGYSIFAPEYSYNRVGYPLFKNVYPTSVTYKSSDKSIISATTAYGTISTSGDNVTDDSSVLDLFKYPVPTEIDSSSSYKVFRCINGTIVNITNAPKLNWTGWRIFFRQKHTDTTNNEIPNKITITYTRTSTRYRGYTGDSTATVPTTDEFNYAVSNGIIDNNGVLTYTGTYTHSFNDYITVDNSIIINSMYGQPVNGPITDITNMSIKLNSASSYMNIYGLAMMFTGDYYDIKQNTMYDKYNNPIDKRVYLGQFRNFTHGKKDSDDKYISFSNDIQIVSIGDGTSTVIDTNKSSITDRNIFTIPNPYFSPEVSLSIDSLLEEDIVKHVLTAVTNENKYTGSKKPIFSVVDINCRDITISTISSARKINVKRKW